MDLAEKGYMHRYIMEGQYEEVDRPVTVVLLRIAEADW